jgi:hypothetical protein
MHRLDWDVAGETKGGDMKRMREVEVKHYVVAEVICDLCGRAFREETKQEAVVEVKRVELCAESFEDSFGDLICHNKLKPDLCWSCWEDKVLPALRQLGLTREYEER